MVIDSQFEYCGWFDACMFYPPPHLLSICSLYDTVSKVVYFLDEMRERAREVTFRYPGLPESNVI